MAVVILLLLFAVILVFFGPAGLVFFGGFLFLCLIVIFLLWSLKDLMGDLSGLGSGVGAFFREIRGRSRNGRKGSPKPRSRRRK